MTPQKRKTLPKTARKIPLDFSLTTVNIVLLLIFFFLVSGSLIETEELSVDLAQTTELPLDRLPRPLLLMDVPPYSGGGRTVRSAEHGVMLNLTTSTE